MMKVDKFNTEVSGKSLMYVIENVRDLLLLDD